VGGHLDPNRLNKQKTQFNTQNRILKNQSTNSNFMTQSPTPQELKKIATLQGEVTQTRRRIEVLREIENKEEYLAIPDTAISDPVPVLLISSNFTLLEANDSFMKLGGFSNDTLTPGFNVLSLFPADQQIILAKKVSPNETWETQLLKGDGSWCSVIIGLTQISPSNFGWLIYFFDVSERKKLQKDLQMKDENLRTLLEAVPHLIWVCDTTGNITNANGALANFLSRSNEELLNLCWLDFVSPPDRETLGSNSFSLGEFYADFQTEVRLVDGQGNQRWHLLRVNPFFCASQASLSWFVIATDIDNQKKVTEALVASEEQLRVIADAMPQIVWTANAEGHIDFWNHRFFEYSGLSVQQSLHGGWRLLIHNDDLHLYDKAWLESLETGEVLKVNFRLKRALGIGSRRRPSRTNLGSPNSHNSDYLLHLCRAVPVKGQNGEVLRWFGTWTEIHDHQRQPG
jgi:PAS domain S-box-containing protein